MKKSIFLSLIGIATMLVGCNSQPADVVNPGNETVQIQVTTEQTVQDRADATGVDNYVIEVYSDNTYATPANVFTNQTTNTITNATGSFTAILDRSKDYYILCWADRKVGGTSAYTTTSLKAVKLTTETSVAAEAWFGASTIAKGTSSGTIAITPLKRAVAKITLKETGIMLANKAITATFKQPTTFNVADGKATVHATADRTVTIANGATDITGTIQAPATIGNVEFILANADGNVLDMNLSYDGQTAITTSNIPLQANRNTNLIGHFSSIFSETLTATCTDDWDTTENTFPDPLP